VLTGTPSGVGPIQPGQRVEVTIQGLGSLDNSVAAAEGVSTASGAR
jgi:2-keto-4-pentenoate hydratase/2-oxohepta-3-ene-1,7-dioic acid hydratase in catechol pathway